MLFGIQFIFSYDCSMNGFYVINIKSLLTELMWNT